MKQFVALTDSVAYHAAQIATLAVDQKDVIIIQLEAWLAVRMVTEMTALWNHALQKTAVSTR